MKIFKKQWTLLSMLAGGLLLSGCIGYETYCVKIDFVSGNIEYTYRNLTSNEARLQGDKDSVESDWKYLKEMVEKSFKAEEGKSDGLEGVTAKLYEDAGVLSGTMTGHFAKSASSLEARLDVLNKQLTDYAIMRLSDGMIVMLTKEGKEIFSSNGKITNFPKKQDVITWPANTKKLEVTFRGDSTKSLLPYYLKEQKK